MFEIRGAIGFFNVWPYVVRSDLVTGSIRTVSQSRFPLLVHLVILSFVSLRIDSIFGTIENNSDTDTRAERARQTRQHDGEQI